MADKKIETIPRKRISSVVISDNEFYHVYDTEEPAVANVPKFGCRYVQALLMGFGLVVGISTRSNMSVAIVAMTDNTTSPNPDIATYDWNNTSVILSSYFWGYISFQILAGYLGKTYGPKYFLFVGILVNSCALALTPLAAQQWGSNGVIFCRITQGLGQGFLYPSAHVILGRWAPEEERNTLTNIIYTGAPLGSILGTLLTGYVSASWWGWPASFYILASFGVTWSILWIALGQNSPAEHPRITDDERNYIQASLQQEDTDNLAVPWKKIFTCFPFYVAIISGLGTNWGAAVLLTETPTYMAKIMNFDVKSSSLVSAVPTLGSLIASILIGPLSDWIISKKYMSLLNTRKVFQAIGVYGQALCLLWVSFLQPSQAVLSVIVLSVGTSFGMCMYVGASINHLDLSPRFSGILFGIVNACGQGISIIASLSTNWIVTDLYNVSQWQVVFITAAGFLILAGSCFIVFGSVTRQPWDGPEKSKAERRKKVSVISMMSI